MQLAVQTGSFGGRGILVRVFTTSRVALEQEGLGIASQHANFKMRKLCFPGIQAELQIFLRINIHVDFPLLIAKLVVFWVAFFTQFSAEIRSTVFFTYTY